MGTRRSLAKASARSEGWAEGWALRRLAAAPAASPPCRSGPEWAWSGPLASLQPQTLPHTPRQPQSAFPTTQRSATPPRVRHPHPNTCQLAHYNTGQISLYKLAHYNTPAPVSLPTTTPVRFLLTSLPTTKPVRFLIATPVSHPQKRSSTLDTHKQKQHVGCCKEDGTTQRPKVRGKSSERIDFTCTSLRARIIELLRSCASACAKLGEWAGKMGAGKR